MIKGGLLDKSPFIDYFHVKARMDGCSILGFAVENGTKYSRYFLVKEPVPEVVELLGAARAEFRVFVPKKFGQTSW